MFPLFYFLSEIDLIFHNHNFLHNILYFITIRDMCKSTLNNNLVFTVVGSFVSSLVPSTTMGNFSVFMTFLLGIKFILKPVMTTKEAMDSVSPRKRLIQSIVCGIIIGFICGFVGAGGGMMMLLILTSVLGYELKTAVGTSVFIMTFTALTGAISHFSFGDTPDMLVLCLC